MDVQIDKANDNCLNFVINIFQSKGIFRFLLEFEPTFLKFWSVTMNHKKFPEVSFEAMMIRLSSTFRLSHMFTKITISYPTRTTKWIELSTDPAHYKRKEICFKKNSSWIYYWQFWYRCNKVILNSKLHTATHRPFVALLFKYCCLNREIGYFSAGGVHSQRQKTSLLEIDGIL